MEVPSNRTMSKSYTLNTGAVMPAVAIGTRRTPSPGIVCKMVKDALQAGYRHIGIPISATQYQILLISPINLI